MKIIQSEWDTRVLGVKSGKLENLEHLEPITGKHVRECLDAAKADGVRFVMTRVDTDQVELIAVLQDEGFRVVSTLQRMRLLLRDSQGRAIEIPTVGLNEAVTIRPAEKWDVSRIGDLAATGFIQSRIHNDQQFSRVLANEFYAEWARCATRGDVHDGVFVAELDGKVAGYMVHQGEMGITGRFVLMSVDPNLRRSGVARALATHTARHYQGRAYRYAEAGAEATSVAVMNLYISMGFKAYGPWTSLHWHDR